MLILILIVEIHIVIFSGNQLKNKYSYDEKLFVLWIEKFNLIIPRFENLLNKKSSLIFFQNCFFIRKYFCKWRYNAVEKSCHCNLWNPYRDKKPGFITALGVYHRHVRKIISNYFGIFQPALMRTGPIYEYNSWEAKIFLSLGFCFFEVINSKILWIQNKFLISFFHFIWRHNLIILDNKLFFGQCWVSSELSVAQPWFGCWMRCGQVLPARSFSLSCSGAAKLGVNDLVFRVYSFPCCKPWESLW